MTSTATKVGIYILFTYAITKILDFYGFDISQYGSYLAFYSFILLSMMVLPNDYYTLNLTTALKPPASSSGTDK